MGIFRGFAALLGVVPALRSDEKERADADARPCMRASVDARYVGVPVVPVVPGRVRRVVPVPTLAPGFVLTYVRTHIRTHVRRYVRTHIRTLVRTCVRTSVCTYVRT